MSEWNETSHYKEVPFRNSNHRKGKRKKMVERFTSKECEMKREIYQARNCIGIDRFHDSNFCDN